MKSQIHRLAITLGTGLMLIGCSRSAPTQTAVHPTRLFLQTRNELPEKYGASANTATLFSPGERLDFISDNLSISAEVAGEECHYIRSRLPHVWTDGQIGAALEKNGTAWSILPSTTLLFPRTLRYPEYKSSEGRRAKVSPVSKTLEIWSARLVSESQERADTKRRKEAAIPKFWPSHRSNNPQ